MTVSGPDGYDDRFTKALYSILGDPDELNGRSRWTRYLYEPLFHAETYEAAQRIAGENAWPS